MRRRGLHDGSEKESLLSKATSTEARIPSKKGGRMINNESYQPVPTYDDDEEEEGTGKNSVSPICRILAS